MDWEVAISAKFRSILFSTSTLGGAKRTFCLSLQTDQALLMLEAFLSCSNLLKVERLISFIAAVQLLKGSSNSSKIQVRCCHLNWA